MLNCGNNKRRCKINKYRSTYLFHNLEIYSINSFINIIKIFLNGSPHVDFYGYIQFLGVFIHNYICYIDITKKYSLMQIHALLHSKAVNLKCIHCCVEADISSSRSLYH